VIEYVKTYGEPGEPKVRVHLQDSGQDMTICGLDSHGDDEVHDKDPETLSFGRHVVNCEDCQRIIEAVKEHIKPKKIRS